MHHQTQKSLVKLAEALVRKSAKEPKTKPKVITRPHLRKPRVYVIDLRGQGDRELFLVPEDCWKWINQETDAVPKAVLAVIDKDDASASDDNDRALHASAVIEYDHFTGAADLVRYVEKHKLKIAGEYEGYIY
jgi:hypothetical protein